MLELKLAVLFYDIAVEHAFVCYVAFPEVLLEVAVYVVESLPYILELILDIALDIGVEVLEETAYSLNLFLLKRVLADTHLAQVLYVGKEPACVGKVLVNVIEVPYEHLAPIVERVE